MAPIVSITSVPGCGDDYQLLGTVYVDRQSCQYVEGGRKLWCVPTISWIFELPLTIYLVWEDSVEIQSNISWIPSLPHRFFQKHDYSLRPHLPLLLSRGNNIGLQSPADNALDCILNTPDQGQGYVNDYHSSLVDGYREYLQTLAEWEHSRLNLQLLAQVLYDFPMDMAANIPFVDAPECESLAFMDSIDVYQ